MTTYVSVEKHDKLSFIYPQYPLISEALLMGIYLQVTDFVIILNKRSAVDAFSKGGNLTLGGNFTIAAGPLGRNLEADVAVRSTAAIFTYSKTRGIFAGISVEGSGLIERKDANRKQVDNVWFMHEYFSLPCI